ncbi:CamS family sex pheromone protein [Salsuginibacillus kocurii]|uniref:CamS family sex pheromone protein n=1 Tax=Salsuginibacillus kocurii TaxID=427078 RepID=UPI0003612215|nr:CamS family sex pheromone protein [Salsuginibacillus kocurii]
MKRFVGLMALSSLVILSGCLSFLEPEDDDAVELDEAEEEEEEGVEVSPDLPALEDQYRTVLSDGQYMHGSTRGFSTSVVYNRMDIERMETGLLEVASEDYNPNDYFFREGQFINRDELDSWLRRQHEEDNPDGLNPPLADGESFEEQERGAPRMLSHIVEHNYMVENDEGNLQLGGIVVGLSMNSLYYFREQHDDGTYGPWLDEEISESESLEAGQEVAEEVVERLRSNEREDGMLEEVPITVALYREAPREAPVPGTFIATSTAEPGASFGGWDIIDEDYYLFPSSEASQDHVGEADRFDEFRESVDTFFENYVGATGEGRFQNDQLQEMTIEIPIRFHSKTEVISFTQHVTNLLENYPPDVDIEVTVSSNSGEEALITREPNEEPDVHVYR